MEHYAILKKGIVPFIYSYLIKIIMEEIDPRLKKLENYLRQTNVENPSDPGVILNLWPTHTLEKVLKNPSFYEQPITQPKLMNLNEFYTSLKIKNVPVEIIEKIVLVNVEYRGFDNKTFNGQIIIHKDLAASIKKVFKRILLETDFPMTSVFPISMYNGYASSLKLNNCGTFDLRFVSSSNEISDHSFGAAIDINPFLNPWVQKGLVNSQNFSYNPSKKGTLHAGLDVIKIFKEEGWKWGGDWKNSKDWMHFYRPEIPHKYYGKIEVEE